VEFVGSGASQKTAKAGMLSFFLLGEPINPLEKKKKYEYYQSAKRGPPENG
jgi:hypothetical protein